MTDEHEIKRLESAAVDAMKAYLDARGYGAVLRLYFMAWV